MTPGGKITAKNSASRISICICVSQLRLILFLPFSPTSQKHSLGTRGVEGEGASQAIEILFRLTRAACVPHLCAWGGNRHAPAPSARPTEVNSEKRGKRERGARTHRGGCSGWPKSLGGRCSVGGPVASSDSELRRLLDALPVFPMMGTGMKERVREWKKDDIKNEGEKGEKETGTGTACILLREERIRLLERHIDILLHVSYTNLNAASVWKNWMSRQCHFIRL